MYVSLKWCVDSYIFLYFVFRSHSRLWSYRKFHCCNLLGIYWPIFFSYTVEILPYALRAKGFVMFNFFISLSLIFNQYVTFTFLHSLFFFIQWLSSLDMWIRLPLASKSFCWDVYTKFAHLLQGWAGNTTYVQFSLNYCARVHDHLTWLKKNTFVSSFMWHGFSSRMSSVTSLLLRRRT